MSDEFEVVYSSWYNFELEAIQREHQIRIEQKLALFRAKGWLPSIRDRTIAPLQDGIYELRILGTGPAFRILFFLVPGRSPRVVVLTTCATKALMKKRNRLDAEVARAVERRSGWLEQQRKRENDAGR